MTSYADCGLSLRNNHIIIKEPHLLHSVAWDAVAYAAVFGDRQTRITSRYVIGEVARSLGIKPASINALYRSRGCGVLPDNFTVPALNLRGMVYDTARAIFVAMKKMQVGAVIFELSKSEAEYTAQSPEEYACVILAAAVRENYRGPLFFQADHTQLRAQAPAVAAENESTRLKHYISRCIRAGFYNIDIDGSTLVDLAAPTIPKQQESNIRWTSELTRYIRQISPPGMAISVGGEIGHIGDRNSTVTDFEVFASGLQQSLGELESISKVSVQTGTSHGGVVNKDGSLGKMQVDFDILSQITQAAKKYAIGGSVQHGASTLPDSEFHFFPKHHTLEIHLATGWQNLLFESQFFPRTLRQTIYRDILASKTDSTLTDPQYIYKNRKRAWGPFKQKTWDIDPSAKSSLRQELTDSAERLFDSLKVTYTLDLINKYALVDTSKRSIHDYQGD